MTDQVPKPDGEWEKYLKTFKKSPISHSLYWLSSFFAIGGFIYNNLQNPNRLFISSWFYDAFALSWTNLLIIPTLIVTFYWGLTKKDWSDLKEVASYFFWSPFVWIGGYLLLRIAYKSLLLINDFFTSIFTWLGN